MSDGHSQPLEGHWDAATWDGARRAQLRRALQLTVRERLEVLDALAETSRRLIRAGRAAHGEADEDGKAEPDNG